MKTRKTVISALLIAVSLSLFAFPSAAFVEVRRDVPVTVDGERYLGETVLYHDTTYVSLRQFLRLFGISSVSWDDGTKTASVVSYYLILTASDGCDYVVANGRCLYCEHGVFSRGYDVFVPLRVIAKACGASVGWDEASFSASVARGYLFIEPAAYYYDLYDVYWLSHIIHAEAGCEPLIGKIAVGNVVLNRVASSAYPDTIYGVIFDMRCGPQFTPAATGSVYADPDDESIVAAKIVLDGYSISHEIEFFMNPRTADTEWMMNNCTFCFSIARHDFYKA